MIERVEAGSPDELRERFAGRESPLLISRSVAEDVRAECWSPSHLLEAVGERTVSVLKAEGERFDYDERGERNYTDFKSTFAGALRIVSAAHSPGPCYYIRQASLKHLGLGSEGLVSESLIPARVARRSHLWLSSDGCVTPLHYDGKNNLLTQMHGAKRVTLLPPTEYARIYPYGVGHYATHASRVNPEQVDAVKFPQFPKSLAVSFDLLAGDTLFIPAFWWHHIRSLELSVSVNDWWAARPAQYLVEASVDYLRLRYKRDKLRQIFAPEDDDLRPVHFAELAAQAHARRLACAATLFCGASTHALLESLARAHGISPPAPGESALSYATALAARGLISPQEDRRAQLSLVLAELAATQGRTPKPSELETLISETRAFVSQRLRTN
ncbi:MAG TPA: cupin-like domain-containing protein [Pyrinomonadaceae bacterium]|jgi:hypothetical protein|nr:cupin-like domain-containing protein [Pyrinomonadaceae bacterium]